MEHQSHPSIEFRHVPMVPGVLSDLEQLRPALLRDVAMRTRDDFHVDTPDLERVLSEALYNERYRLKHKKRLWLRPGADEILWKRVQNGLLKPAAEVDRAILLEQVIDHYAEEIGGHFDSRVYRVASRVTPVALSFLLNTGMKRLLPWKGIESLRDCIHIVGEVPLLQKLATRGTVLLVPTHQSNFDSLLIGYALHLMSLPPFAYGAGLNLFSNPLIGYFLRKLGSYTVDRQKQNAIYKQTLKNYSVRSLRAGIHSIFFPGGGRSRSGSVETRIKLGLLGTGLDAQLENMQRGHLDSRVYVVPMVMSYHFVLEASALIEDYLADVGKHRFLLEPDVGNQLLKILGFAWKVFSSRSAITVRVGRPLDIFGNFVDDDGTSIGPQGLRVDHARWLTTRGELRAEPERDAEYTRQLGGRLLERYYRENTAIASHLVAFVLFETLRKKYQDFDLFRFLRLRQDQRSLLRTEFMQAATHYHERLMQLVSQEQIRVAPELMTSDMERWVNYGVQQLGLFHEGGVVKMRDDVVTTTDLRLLYYYRNRLAGYGLSLLADQSPGSTDGKGFLV